MVSVACHALRQRRVAPVDQALRHRRRRGDAAPRGRSRARRRRVRPVRGLPRRRPGSTGCSRSARTARRCCSRVDERRRGLEAFIAAAAGRLRVAAHCGAQTTADTVALAEHAAGAGADAVAVIGPPYFKLDAEAQRRHLVAAAQACAPLPVLRLRVRRHRGLPVRRRDAPPSAGVGPERDRAQGLGHPMGGVRALPARGARRVRRPGGADPPCARGWCRRGRLGARVGVPRAGRGGRARADSRRRRSAR